MATNSKTAEIRDGEVLERLRQRLQVTQVDRTMKIGAIIDRLEDAHPATRLAAEVVIQHALASCESDPFEWFTVPTFGHPKPQEILPGVLFSWFTDSSNEVNEIRAALLATGEFYKYGDFVRAAKELQIPDVRASQHRSQYPALKALNRIVLWQAANHSDAKWRDEYLTPTGKDMRSNILTWMFLLHADLVADYVESMAETAAGSNNSIAIAAMVNGRESLARRFLAG